MDGERCGCFAWCVSFKKSVNERWARFRNRLRRRFYARRGQTVDPASVVNETGTDDLIISKKPYNSDKAVVFDMSPGITAKGEHVPAEGVATTDCATFDTLVHEYVAGVINKAAEVLRSENHTVFNDPKVIVVQSADDNISLSSSVISQIADTIVTESLTSIVLDSDTNQSAEYRLRPRTIREFKEMFGIADTNMAAGLPSVSD